MTWQFVALFAGALAVGVLAHRLLALVSAFDRRVYDPGLGLDGSDDGGAS